MGEAASPRPCSRPRRSRTSRARRRATARPTPRRRTAPRPSSSSNAMSQAGPCSVWTSSAISTSRSRDGSNRFVTGRPSRALARWWIRRSGSPGAYGRTPANRAGSSVRPRPDALDAAPAVGPLQVRAWRRSAAGRGTSSSTVALLDGGLASDQVADRQRRPARGRRRRAARPRRGSGGSPAPTARASRRSAARRPATPVDEGSLPDDDARGVASSSARSQASGRRLRFQTSIVSGISSPHVVRSRREMAGVRHVAQAVAGPDLPDRLERRSVNKPRTTTIGTSSDGAGEDQEDRRRAPGPSSRSSGRRGAGPGRIRGSRPAPTPASRRAGSGRGRRRAGGRGPPGATALTSSGRTNARPARTAAAWATR